MTVTAQNLPNRTRPYIDVNETITLVPTGTIIEVKCETENPEPDLIITRSGNNLKLSGKYREEFEDKIYFVDRGRATTVDSNMNYTPRFPLIEQPPQVVYGFEEMPPEKDIFRLIEDPRAFILKTFTISGIERIQTDTTYRDEKFELKVTQQINNTIGTLGESLRLYLLNNTAPSEYVPPVFECPI